MPFKPGEIPKGAKPWKKGESGNPAGRPKMPDLKEACAKALDNGELEKIIVALRKKAQLGDVRAAQELMDRAYGKSTQAIDLSATGEFQHEFVVNIVNSPPDES